jgi:hypothetical protein
MFLQTRHPLAYLSRHLGRGIVADDFAELDLVGFLGVSSSATPCCTVRMGTESANPSEHRPI